ncbi:MAG: hypothetical protein AB1898_24970 [Acidobacteriota bacterium]
MKFWRLAYRNPRLLLVINSLLALLLLAWAASGFREREVQPRVPSPTEGEPLVPEHRELEALLGAIRQAAERVQDETRIVAELASHIFSNPESYRLAAQPGEYDFDQATGVYGSTRNDGNSAVVVSGATPLSPELLREIRLSEYLNPLVKNLAAQRPDYLQITLCTRDSVIRSFPWFDFKQRLAGGFLNKDFKAADFPYFSKAQKASDKRAVWSASNQAQAAVCSAPVTESGEFKGAVAIQWDFGRSLAALDGPAADPILLLADENDEVLLVSPRLASLFPRNRPSTPITFRNLTLPEEPGIQQALAQVRRSHEFRQSVADYYLQAVSVPHSSLRAVGVIPSPRVGSSAGPQKSNGPTLPGRFGGLLLGLAAVALLVSAVGVQRLSRGALQADEQLSKAVAEMGALDWEAARIRAQDSIFQRTFVEWNSSLAKLRSRFEELETRLNNSEKGQDAGPSELQGSQRALELVQSRLELLSVFRANQPRSAVLSALTASLARTFGAERCWVLFPTGPNGELQSQCPGHGVEDDSLRKWTVPADQVRSGVPGLGEGRGSFCNEPPGFATWGWETFRESTFRNCFAGPLLEGNTLAGLVLLADREQSFTEVDVTRFEDLREVLAIVLKNMLHSEGLHKVDALRRQYCLELSRAVEAPLNLIRSEVQAIYSRLGKLTPYFKEHCEVILFEVGRLYEIAREASDQEKDSGSDGSLPEASS